MKPLRDHAFIQVRGSWSRSVVTSKKASSCGSSFLCTAGTPVDSGDAVFLGSHTGFRLAVNSTEVDASGMHRELFEVFTLLKAQGDRSGIFSGDKLFLRAYNDKFVSVNDSKVFAEYSHSLIWETFQLIRRAGPGRLLSGDSISLIAHTSKRISVHDSSVVAKWDHDLDWEALTVQKVTPPWQLPSTGGGEKEPPRAITTKSPSVTLTTTTPPLEDGAYWYTQPTGNCEFDLGCHRHMHVTCWSADGRILEEGRCNATIRPSDLEKCLILGAGSCVNVAPSDCMDVRGKWWNRWHKSCTELSQAGGCSGGALAVEQLPGWRKDDQDFVRSTCRASCRLCNSGQGAPETSEPSCHDDLMYKSPNNQRCYEFTGAAISCDDFDFADDLKVACPRACGECL